MQCSKKALFNHLVGALLEAVTISRGRVPLPSKEMPTASPAAGHYWRASILNLYGSGSPLSCYPPPNYRVRSHITAAKLRLTALCNSRAPPAALGRQESVGRVVVCKSVARMHGVPCGLPTRPLHNCRAEPFRNWGTPTGLKRHSLKEPKRPLREQACP